MPRRRKSAHEHWLNGTYEPGKHGPKVTPFPALPGAGAAKRARDPARLPALPPEHLGMRDDPDLVARWRTVRRDASWLLACDTGLVALWVQHSARFETAMAGRNAAAAEGDPEGAVAAYSSILDREGALLMRLAKGLGFTPMARQRLRLTSPERG